MAKYGEGNGPRGSTAASLGTDPSSGALLAEVKDLLNVPYEVRYFVGGSTAIIWRLQQCLSSGLASTAVVDETVVLTPANQSGQYVIKYDRLPSTTFSSNARFRVMTSTGVTAQIGVKLFAEPLI